MNELAFDHFHLLHLLWIVAAVAAVGVYGVWQRQRALRLFASLKLLPRLAPPGGWLRPLARLTLIVLCLTTLTAALLGPRWGRREQTLIRRGVDVIVLLDVSRSMLARDIAPSRLERAKLSIRDDLLPALGGDRIGLIAFAGAASLVCPLTSDYGFFRLALEDVGPQSVASGGTMIGDAIRKAAEGFRGPLDTYKVVLLITDGEDQGSFPIEAARVLWEEQKIPIVAVALGDEREGARVPEKPGGEKFLEYKGQTVWSKANFDDLRKIAAVSELNAFVPVGTRNFDLGEIYRTRIIPAIKGREQREKEVVPLPSQYHWFAVAALVLLLLESFLREGPRQAKAAVAAEEERKGLAA